MGANQPPVPEPEVLRALEERNLVFELMAHSDQLDSGRSATRRCHRPHRRGGAHRMAPLRTPMRSVPSGETGLQALADLGDNVACKLSGLAMPLESMTVDAFAPWIEFAIEVFGPDRCMFASNFPVDAMQGTFNDLYGVFSALTTGLDDASVDKLFAGTAERVYRLG